MSHPQARCFEHVRELDGELVVVDAVHDVAHRLTAQTARIWRACDGTVSGPRLAAAAGVDQATAAAAVDELRALCLLEEGGTAPLDTRRSMLRKAVLTGAAAGVAGSLISSVVLPTPAQAFDSQPGSSPQSQPAAESDGGDGGGATPQDGDNVTVLAEHAKTRHKRKPHRRAHHRKHHRKHHAKHHRKHHAKHHRKHHAKHHRRKGRHG